MALRQLQGNKSSKHVARRSLYNVPVMTTRCGVSKLDFDRQSFTLTLLLLYTIEYSLILHLTNATVITGYFYDKTTSLGCR